MAVTTHRHSVGFDCLEDCAAGTDMTSVVKMLENRIMDLEEIAMHDAELREKYPALQALWDEYQTTKALVKTYGKE